MTDLLEVHKAVKMLLRREDYAALKREILTLAKTEHGGFQDDLFVLDPLVNLAREEPVDRIDNLFKLCDDYHRRSNPDYRKTVYQRNYMAERRHRLSQAVKLKQRTENRLLNAEAREEFRSEIQAWWMLLQDQWIEERGGKRTPELIRQFWETLESDMADGLKGDREAARRVLGV